MTDLNLKLPITQLPNYSITQLLIAFILVFLITQLLNYSITNVSAQAQNAQLHVTWQAHNFYPADFPGKSLLTQGATAALSVQAAKDGKLLDLQNASITWLLDGKILSENAKETVFTATKGVGEAHLLKVSVKLGGEVTETSLRLPIAKPQVVIESPLAGRAARTGSRVELQAVPYFFNVSALSELDFIWKINQQAQNTVEFNRLILNIGEAAAPTLIGINSFVQNRENPFEVAKEFLEMTIVR